MTYFVSEESFLKKHPVTLLIIIPGISILQPPFFAELIKP